MGLEMPGQTTLPLEADNLHVHSHHSPSVQVASSRARLSPSPSPSLSLPSAPRALAFSCHSMVQRLCTATCHEDIPPFKGSISMSGFTGPNRRPVMAKGLPRIPGRPAVRRAGHHQGLCLLHPGDPRARCRDPGKQA